jgi:hypothetical protein
LLEFAGKKIVVLDVSEELPRHPSKRWPKRTSAIHSLALHHSDGSVRLTGLEAAKATAAFSCRRDDPKTKGLEGHDWAGIPYHFYVPFAPWNDGSRIVVYRCLADDRHSNHVDAFNGESIGVCFQGSFKSNYNPLGHQPSGLQAIVWEELAPHLRERYSIDHWETWPHAWRGKPACPGDTITWWLLRDRDRDPSRITSKAALREHLAMVLDRPGLREERADGYDLVEAVKDFQRSQIVVDVNGKRHGALKVDGCFGPATETHLRRELRKLGAVL